MSIAAALESMPGVERAAVVMATPANVELLVDLGLPPSAVEGVTPSDLVVALAATDAASLDAALQRAQALLEGEPVTQGRTADSRPRSLAGALRLAPGANLAVISTPGPFAAAEALKALKRGLHVFCFSDNLSLEDEVRLKRLAEQRGLLCMGPDCGTSIIDGVPIGFANATRPGRVGLVSASGTGLQEVICILDRAGEGVSQAIGVGSRDLHQEVGGAMIRAGLQLLGDDPATEVIVLISKPPADSVATAIVGAAQAVAKPVVACFLGAEPAPIKGTVRLTGSLLEAAQQALRLLGGELAQEDSTPPDGWGEAPAGTTPGTIRGLFSGGTLLFEAERVLRTAGFVERGENGADHYQLIDLGDDQYTLGRPHPMIDPRDRAARIRAAAEDASVGVILLDVVLGFGAHPDPAVVLAPAIAAARAAARASSRSLGVVVSVCGTKFDPQGLAEQRTALSAAGAVVTCNVAAAARAAAVLASHG